MVFWCKKGRHVVLEGSHVAMEVQHDVAGEGSGEFEVKRDEKREPRRIGRQPCRDGGPTRRGSKCKLKAGAVVGYILRHY